jgi:hypothetical protein
VPACLLTGCLSAGERQTAMVCDPSVADRCVPVPDGRLRTPAPEGGAPVGGELPAVRDLGGGAELSTFSGTYFSVGYPQGWRVETAERPTRSYLDTTIRKAGSRWTYLRVDVTPRLGEADPSRHARRVEAYLRRQPGYRRLAFERTAFGPAAALRWEFTVRESGVLLRKVDVFLTDAEGNGFAILAQAPAREFRGHAPLFERLLTSVVPRAGGADLFAE